MAYCARGHVRALLSRARLWSERYVLLQSRRRLLSWRLRQDSRCKLLLLLLLLLPHMLLQLLLLL